MIMLLRLPFWGIVLANLILGAWYRFHPTFPMVEDVFRLNTTLSPTLILLAGLVGIALWYLKKERRKHLALGSCMVVAALALFVLGIWVLHIEPYALKVREVSMTSDKVDQPLRLLHITDIQSASIGAYEEQAFEIIRSLDADLIIHTGDMLQPTHPDTYWEQYPKLFNLFKTLDAPLGVFGIYGNTDRYYPMTAEEHGLTMLTDQHHELKFGNTAIDIYGMSLDVSQNPTSTPTILNEWLATSDAKAFTILLGHSPDYLVEAVNHPIDLCLAGHTHGGQIRLPFIGPLWTATEYIPRSWARGFRQAGQTHINVSAGIGCEHADGIHSMRFLCPPEMTLITILPAK